MSNVHRQSRFVPPSPALRGWRRCLLLLPLVCCVACQSIPALQNNSALPAPPAPLGESAVDEFSEARSGIGDPTGQAATATISHTAGERQLIPTAPQAPSEHAVRQNVTHLAIPAVPISQASEVALATANLPLPRVGHRGHAGCPHCASGGGMPAHLPPSAYFTGHIPMPAPEAALEYLCNGGDQPPPVLVKNDWTVHGLDSGDAVAHYDTIDHRVEVAPSNEVCIYAPRFAAVRKVTAVVAHEQHQREAGVDLPLRLIERDETQIAATAVQPLQPERHLSVHMAQRFQEQTRGANLENLQLLGGMRSALLPYEDFLLIQRGQFDNAEKARLATRLQAAFVWTHELGVQLVIDDQAAVEAVHEGGLQSVYRYELPRGKPRMRVVKVASADSAQPGDIIDFTLRFDNVGDQVVGNVTIVDHLVTRLEYVPDSQQCSVEADFFTQDNASSSLTLRWEIKKPLQVGQGGVIRFQCRVR